MVVTASNMKASAAKEGAVPFLQIRRVVKQFDEVFAVDDVSLDIQQGEIFFAGLIAVIRVFCFS